MSDKRDNFLQGLLRARRAMAAANIDLAAIELMTPEDGERLLALLEPQDVCGRMAWLRDDGSPGAQIELEGVLVRWPQRRIARFGGGWVDSP